MPVPVPQFPAQLERLEGLARDCDPGAVLTTAALAASLAPRLATTTALGACPWLSIDSVADEAHAACGGDLPAVDPAAIALLQYTSGSTTDPRGVAVSHANLAHNATTILRELPVPEGGPSVSWLPHFHDTGLIAGIVAPLYRDGPSVLLAPMTFLQRPLRWLEAISHHRARTSGAPNFAYARCVRAAVGVDLSGLDLSGWEVAFVGAEPVRPATLEAFAACFAPCGFRAESLTPCYGMAEVTLLVSSKRIGTSPTVHAVACAALEAGAARPSRDREALRLMGCGDPVTGTDLRIVDPVRRLELPRGRVGEIWLAGPQVACAYWRGRDPEVFGGMLADSGGGPFLRTGDLGFLSGDGELVFVERLKDLLILNGQNHLCHDLELTVGTSHPLLTPETCLVCGIEADEREQVLVAAEVPAAAAARTAEAAEAIRGALFRRHGLPVHSVVFVAPRRLSRTTSGKLQRRRTAGRVLRGDLHLLAHHGEPLPCRPSATAPPELP